jgi:hypothetical protein
LKAKGYFKIGEEDKKRGLSHRRLESVKLDKKDILEKHVNDNKDFEKIKR